MTYKSIARSDASVSFRKSKLEDNQHAHSNALDNHDIDVTARKFNIPTEEYTPAVHNALNALSVRLNDLQVRLVRTQDLLTQAETLADHDALVPVFNRRAFMRELERLISFSDRYDSNFTFIYLDLDNFKTVNDQFGHAIGDKLLKQVGDVLISETRESDIIGRLGGDEFGIALMQTRQEEGQEKAVSLAEQIAALGMEEIGANYLFGATCGVVLRQRQEQADKLISRADRAMYADKALKNAVRIVR